MKRVSSWLLTGLVLIPAGRVGMSISLRSGEYLFVLDLQGTPLDEFPSSVKALNGVMTVVEKDGQHMLRASSPSEFLITLPQMLPVDFTVELDFIPKACCAPDDITLEGTPTRNRGVASAELTWHSERISAVGGSPNMYQSAMPADLAAATPGNLTHVVVVFQGPTIKLYTNGRRLYTLDKQFARGRVLRVGLGGADDGRNAVCLASFRVAAGTWAPVATVATQTPADSPNQVASQQSASTGNMVTNSNGSIRPVGSSAPRIASTTTSTEIAAAVNPAATATGPVLITPNPVRTSPALPDSTTSPPPPPPPPPATRPMIPVGAGVAPEVPPPQAPGTPGSMRLDDVPFNIVLLQGGSLIGSVVETRLADGSVKKNLGQAAVEPLVFDVSPGSPIDGWLKSWLSNNWLLKSGALFGGVVPAQQELDFLNGMLTSVTIPTLDAASTAPAFLRATVTPEATVQAALSGAVVGSVQGWTSSDFRLSIGDLETSAAVRIEPITIKAVLSESTVGDQRVYTKTPTGAPALSNLLVSFAVDATHPAANWLAWYDDFVIKGNNDDSHEKTLTLELGVGKTGGPARLTLKGYGVGIVALRTLPQPAYSTLRRMQAELYVERMDVYP